MKKRHSSAVRIVALLLAVVFAFSSSVASAFSLTTGPTRNPLHAYIPAGTNISCELITPLNSGRNYQGERVMFKTTGAVTINGVMVIPTGAAGEAVVSEVRKAGGFGRGGKIAINTRSLKTVNGMEVPVTFQLSKSGGGQGGWVIPAFVLITILAGFIQGQNQDLPPGTRFSVAVENDFDLGVEPEMLAEVMVDPNDRKAAAAAQAALAPKAPPAPDIMTVEQAAAYLQVPVATVHYLINEGKLKASKVGDSYRIKKTDIDNML